MQYWRLLMSVCRTVDHYFAAHLGYENKLVVVRPVSTSLARRRWVNREGGQPLDIEAKNKTGKGNV